jgi:hypothetical protein
MSAEQPSNSLARFPDLFILFTGQEPLDWLQRIKIALGSAHGMQEVLILQMWVVFHMCIQTL